MTYHRRQLAYVLATKSVGSKLRPTQIRAVAAYLLQSGRTGDVAPLLRDINLERAKRGYLEVVVTSARPLSARVLQDVKAKARELYPGLKQIQLTEQLDPTLIGGARIVIGEYEFDTSIVGRMQRFTNAALKGGL